MDFMIMRRAPGSALFFLRMFSFLNRTVCLPALATLLFFSSIPCDAAPSFDRRTPLVIAVEKVGPAVVNIFTEESAPARRNPFRQFGNGVLDRFFQDFFPPMDSQRRSLGSGILIHPGGYILTNEHVVAKAVRIKVTLIDKREFDARIVGADMKSDLAVIKIDSTEKLPYVTMGQSDDLMIGETVLAIGNPFGLQHTVTTGIISALNRTIRAGGNAVYHDFIQVDASINPGNSGGPLLNINGELIGINTAIYQSAEGIGFAIPIEAAKRIVNDLIKFGKVRRGWLGVSVQNLSRDMLRFFNIDRLQGVVVVNVTKGSPGHKSGLRRGDVILALDKHPVNSKNDYLDRLASYPIDSTIRFLYVRDGREKTVRVRVSAIPKKYVAEFAFNWLGLRVHGIDKSLAKKYTLTTDKGVVIVEVVPNGAGGRIGIRPGDVVRQVNGHPVNDQGDFEKAIIEAGHRDSVLLLVQRGRYGYYVTLEP